MRSQVLQHESAGGVEMSELQTHHCTTPGQWSWLLCSVSAIPVNKTLLQELNRLIGIEMLTSDFPTLFGSKSQFSAGEKPVLPLLRTPMKAIHRISWKTKCPWKNFKWSVKPRWCSRHLMVCTFIPIKQPKSSRNKRTSTHGNQHSSKKNVTAMTKNIRLLPSNEKQTAWKD